MLKITTPLTKLDLRAYVCQKYWIDDDYKSRRVILKFLKQDDEWKCERGEYLQNDVCNRRDKGDCLNLKMITLTEEKALTMINNFVERSIFSPILEYTVWGYNDKKDIEYDKKKWNARYK